MPCLKTKEESRPGLLPGRHRPEGARRDALPTFAVFRYYDSKPKILLTVQAGGDYLARDSVLARALSRSAAIVVRLRVAQHWA